MRADAKPEGLRQSMSWLHTWSGLLLGWLLYAVFFTGTLSYFVDEINDWMRPEVHASVPQANTAEVALAAMQKIAPDAQSWTLNLPSERQTAIDASWRPQGAPAGRQGQQRAQLDAATGEVIPVRETRGGSFLYRFHFELYAMPRVWARWIVGIATFFMFVAIISGVITHKKIFTDFFTFRPKKGQRSWLDAHNATAVLALPFHIVITFSGLLLFMNMLMPWGAQAVYGGDAQRFNAERRGAMSAPAAAAGERTAERSARRAANAHGPATLAPLQPMLEQATRAWDGASVGHITVQNPNTPYATLELRKGGGASLLNRGAGQRMQFNAHTGEQLPSPQARPVSAVNAVMNTMVSVHLGRFADPAVRWVLFLCGMVGTCMAATGLVLWVVKRLPERRKLGFTPKGHRLVQVLNVAAIAGLSLAVGGYFWSNRLIAADAAARSSLEIQSFFCIWLASLLHAALRPHARAWLEQMAAAAAAFALLPVLNAATGGAPLWRSWAHGQWSVAGFDLMMLALGMIHAAIAWHLLRGLRTAPAAATPRRTAPATHTGAAPVLQAKETQA